VDDKVRIQRTLVRLRNGSWQFDAPKTDKARRTVPLPKGVISALRLHRLTQHTDRLKAGGEWADLDLLFCTREGGPLEWRLVAQRYIKPLMKKAKLENFRPYDLRHTCATLLLASGENAKVVSERLGHATVALTLDVYSHVLPDMQQQAADKFQEMLYSHASGD
jgi:integrase